MGRKSTIVIHPDRADIEDALIRGDSLRDIAEKYDVSISAVHRFSSGPFAAEMRDIHSRNSNSSLPDLLARILHLADDNALLRETAIQAGNVPLAIKLSAAELRALTVLTTTLGIDSGVMIEQAEESTRAARELARGIVIAARENHTVADSVLAALRSDGATDTARQLSDLLTVHAPSLRS